MENPESPAKEKKPRKTYTFKNKAPVVPPPPPIPEVIPPAVLALQDQILGLVAERKPLQDELALANAELARKQADATYIREKLHNVDSEVQYRLRLAAQMSGKAPAPIAAADYGPGNVIAGDVYASYGTQMQGVGSIPTSRPVVIQEGGMEVRRESAESERRAI